MTKDQLLSDPSFLVLVFVASWSQNGCFCSRHQAVSWPEEGNTKSITPTKALLNVGKREALNRPSLTLHLTGQNWVIHPSVGQGQGPPPLQFRGLCQCLNTAAAAKLLQSCLTLCNPIDSSAPGSPIPGILQARTLEWVAISVSNA